MPGIAPESHAHATARAISRVTRMSAGHVAVVTALVALSFVFARTVVAADGEVDRFIVAGRVFTDPAAVDPPIHVFDSPGYDGQFYFRQAVEPLDTSMANVRGVTLDQELRISRVGYPLAAYLVALGQPGVVPWSLVLVNVLAMIALAYFGGRIAQRSGRSAWYGLLVASSSGLMMAQSRDLTELVMVAGLVGGSLAVLRGRFGWAAVAWSVAVLTHEQAAAVVIAYALFRTWSLARRERAPSAADLPWVVPGVLAVAVQLLVGSRTGVIPVLDSGGESVTFPFAGLLPELAGWLTGDLDRQEILVLPELALVVAIVGYAVRCRRSLAPEDGWLLWALAVATLLATLLSPNVWVGPAELRQIVIVPTMAWLIIIRSGRPIPRWLIGATALVWVAVAALRVLAV
jgi:hypothetical protein